MGIVLSLEPAGVVNTDMETDPRLCTIYKRPLDTGDTLAADCGGDCAGCMLQIEHDLPVGITDDELREMEPELDRIAEQRHREAIARADHPVMFEYEQMTDAQKAIVDAGTAEPAGTIPSGLTRAKN
jgi:hypothetical protein